MKNFFTKKWSDLFIYLSKTVRDWFEIGSRLPRHSLDPILSRLCLASLICLCMLTIGVGQMWGATTYKLTLVTSASGLNTTDKYVFEQDGYVMNNSISSNALVSTNSYSTTGLSGSESYIWKLASATTGYKMQCLGKTGNNYLANSGSSTNVSFAASASGSDWSITFTDGIAKITNNSNNGRFLGWTNNSTSHNYKAYASNNNCSTYPCSITVYKLEEEVSCTSSITITKGSNPANGTFTLTSSGEVCIDEGNASTTVNATPNTHYHLATVTSTGGGSVGAISNNSCTVSNISANTTINVTFAADPTYTVTWAAGSNPSFNTQTDYAETALTSPGTPSAALYCPGGKEFVGWTATPIVGEDDEAPGDLFTSVAGKSIPEGGTTYYAVFATNGGGSDPVTDTEHGKTSTPYVANEGWTASAGGTYTSSGNYSVSPSIKFSSNNNYVQSPTYADAITNVTFWHKNQAGAGYLKIYVSTDGSSFTELTGERITLTANQYTVGTKDIDLDYEDGYKAVKIVFDRTSGNCCIDEIAVTYGGGASYSDYATTCASCNTNPTVGTASLKGSVSSSSEAMAQCTGGITNLGGAGCSITSYGFAVGTNTNPTIGGTLTGTGKTYEVETSYTTVNTAFEKLIDGLSASTKYYVRPYATNGNGTAYGTEFNFTTLAACTAAPTVTAGSTGTVTSTTAVVNCSSGLSALGTGGCTVTSYGFVYGTSENPTTSNSTNEVGTSYTTTGTSFNTTLTSLTEGQLYYVRPYATNGYGTGYGTQTSFGTPKITTSLSTRNFGDRKVNGGPYTMTFKVSGVYLQSDISIAKSGTNQAMFSIDKATISQTDGTAAETTITVSYSPTAAGSHSATLTLTSTNATNKTVTLTGTGKWEVTWDVSGSSPTTTLVANSTKPTLPDPAGITSCDGTSTTFIGWTKTPWVGKQNQTYIDGLTGDDVVHTDNTTMSNVTANGTTYYAVFAQANVVEGSKTINITPDTLTSYASVNKKIGGITFKSSNNWGKQTCSSYTYIQGKSGSNFYNDDAFPGYIKSITINPWGSTSCGTVTQGSGTLYIGTSSQPTTNSTTLPTSETTYNYTKTNNYTYFKINASTTLVLFSISITYAADDISYSNYLTTCCNTSTLAFGASPYAVIRQDIQGASTTTWAEVDVTFTSNNTTGTISATTYTSGKTVYSLSSWQSRATTGGSLCATDHAYFEVLTQPSGETPGTGKFHVKTTSGQTGQGTYRIAITQASTDEDHGNFCEKTVYGFVDVTLRDKFVDVVNGNGTVNKDGHGAQLATPLLSELGTQVENACHSEGRKLKGWIKETDLQTLYENGTPASTRVQTIDGLCESCDPASDQKSLVVAPGENITTSGATWYAVWAYEK